MELSGVWTHPWRPLFTTGPMQMCRTVPHSAGHDRCWEDLLLWSPLGELHLGVWDVSRLDVT